MHSSRSVISAFKFKVVWILKELSRGTASKWTHLSACCRRYLSAVCHRVSESVAEYIHSGSPAGLVLGPSRVRYFSGPQCMRRHSRVCKESLLQRLPHQLRGRHLECLRPPGSVPNGLSRGRLKGSKRRRGVLGRYRRLWWACGVHCSTRRACGSTRGTEPSGSLEHGRTWLQCLVTARPHDSPVGARYRPFWAR